MIDLKGQSLRTLSEVLDGLAPINLEGMRLLERLRPTSRQMFPPTTGIDREVLCRATSEIIDYTGRCHRLQTRLLDLDPVPLSGLIVVEFGL